MNKITMFLADASDVLENSEWVNRIKDDTGTDIQITTILNWVYAIAGIVAVAFIVFGAVKYTTSQGEPGKVKEASQAITFAVIGLIIILLATVLTNFVFTSVDGA